MKRQAIFEFGMLCSLFIIVGIWGAMVIAWIGHLVKWVAIEQMKQEQQQQQQDK